LSALLKVARPILQAGGAVSLFDVLMDARAGKIADPPDGMACHDLEGAIALLRRYPRRFIPRLCFTATSALELEFGRLREVDVVGEAASIPCYPPRPANNPAPDPTRSSLYYCLGDLARQDALPTQADLGVVANWLPQTRGWWLPH
jgi:hypothetical protein